MKVINDKIISLKNMGYEVLDNDEFGFVVISLTTHGNFRVNVQVEYRELLYDNSLENIVAEINSYLVIQF